MREKVYYTDNQIERIKKLSQNGTWIGANYQCKKCGSMIIVTEPVYIDYMYYCSNKRCPHHVGTEAMDDYETPDFVALMEDLKK
jgi:hypothetical protein